MKKNVIFLIIILIILGGIQLFLGGLLSAESRQFAELDQEVEILGKENCQLEEKIASFSSLTRINEEALKLGFKNEASLIDYASERPVAFRQD